MWPLVPDDVTTVFSDKYAAEEPEEDSSLLSLGLRFSGGSSHQHPSTRIYTVSTAEDCTDEIVPTLMKVDYLIADTPVKTKAHEETSVVASINCAMLREIGFLLLILCVERTVPYYILTMILTRLVSIVFNY